MDLEVPMAITTIVWPPNPCRTMKLARCQQVCRRCVAQIGAPASPTTRQRVGYATKIHTVCSSSVLSQRLRGAIQTRTTRCTEQLTHQSQTARLICALCTDRDSNARSSAAAVVRPYRHGCATAEPVAFVTPAPKKAVRRFAVPRTTVSAGLPSGSRPKDGKENAAPSQCTGDADDEEEHFSIHACARLTLLLERAASSTSFAGQQHGGALRVGGAADAGTPGTAQKGAGRCLTPCT